MDTQTVQIIFIFVSFAEALAFGLIPVKCKAFKESPRALGIANAFAGGTFIAIALLHIMPEQVASYAEWYKTNHAIKSELAEEA